ncbi:Transcriptional regulator MraZ [bacterium HR15]|nr:Transcriptional regulator MraZ [bacterium HR15]
MAKFQGGSYYAVDDKGRIVIPMRFRSMLGERFIITRGFGGCLFIFTNDQWQRLGDKFDDGALFDPRKIRLQRFLYTNAAEVNPDSQGRVAIPQELRDWAQIEPNSEVLIAGCANWIEIWSRARYESIMQAELENGDELMQLAVEMNI